MSSTTITINQIDLHSIHQQIQLLKELHSRMLPDDSEEAQTLLSTIKIMHALEEGMTAAVKQTAVHH